MAWSAPDSTLSRLLSGNPSSILIALLIALGLPLLLHIFLYRDSRRKSVASTFLLLGASGAGKTALLTILQKRSLSAHHSEASQTHTSQTSNKTRLALPSKVPLGSNKYRSRNDTSLHDTAQEPTKYYLIDTPGHGKLRPEKALSHLEDTSLAGVIYVVDAASLGSGDPAPLKDAASYLHDILLHLQQRKAGKGSSKTKAEIPVLIAANKQDLFTALPAGAVKERLEKAIELVRESKRRGLADVGKGTEEEDDEASTLAGGGEQQFAFKLLEDEFGIQVEVTSGEVRGDDAGRGVDRWENWIGQQL